MDKFLVTGGKSLEGVINVPKAKNSYLALLSACVLCNGEVTLKDCPMFSDINKMLEILSRLGASIKREGKDVIIDARSISSYEVPKVLARHVRSSIFLLGPIIGRLHKARVSYPGGCDIGLRPIDLHLKGLRALNVDIQEKYGEINCECDKLMGNDIHLDYPSVGATENIMMAGVYAKGITRIYNPAKEPEIVDLQNFINSMGGKVKGAGSDVIEIEGVESLSSCVYTPMPDRIIAGTYLLATAAAKGDVTIKNVVPCHIYSLTSKLKEAGFEITQKDDNIRLVSRGRYQSFGKIDTMPYPGFPTDLQPQALVLQTVSKGICVITENLFETRLKHVPELIKMGANIKVKDRTAIVTGVENLYAAEVSATDLRAGASLTIAGLVARGQTIITDVHNIDRGYENLEVALSSLGADIKRI